MKKARILCLSLLCMALLCACGNDDAAHTAVSEPASSESAVSESVSSEIVSSASEISEPGSSEPEPESSEEPITVNEVEPGASNLRSYQPSFENIGVQLTLESFEKHPYLEVTEDTQLPETLPIYEDEFPNYQSQSLYPLDILREEDAKAQMGEYLRLLSDITGQPVPKIEIYVEDSFPLPDQYWFDDVNEQIEKLQYANYGLGIILNTYETDPDFQKAIETMDEAGVLANPVVQTAASYQKIKSPEMKVFQLRNDDEANGDRRFRIAEKTGDFKMNLLYEYFDSLEVCRFSSNYRITINHALPEQPLAKARVIPYETAKKFIENESGCPVLYTEAAYNRDVIYPGRYIPVYRFILEGKELTLACLVPMTDYPIPRNGEMQKYMDESFGEYSFDFPDDEDYRFFNQRFYSHLK